VNFCGFVSRNVGWSSMFVGFTVLRSVGSAFVAIITV
jgi:hypothetical protein